MLVAGVNVLRPDEVTVRGVTPFAFAGEIGLSVCIGIPDMMHTAVRVSQLEVVNVGCLERCAMIAKMSAKYWW